jgi:ABC-type transport system involved in multi-copper enzyme maturation permease subunit
MLSMALTAEADRNRVLASKFLVMVVAVLIAAVAVAATAGGMIDLGTRYADISLDYSQMTRGMVSCIPDCLASATIGFAFGLLTRSLGGGIAIAVAFSNVLSGIFSFLPLLKNLNYSIFEQDIVIHISGDATNGTASHSLTWAVLGVLVWLVVLVVPGWLRFTRGDLK